MKATDIPSVLLLCVTVTILSLLSGCAVGGKSFSIDSNSRVPFFGLELKERKPKSNVPSFDSISRSPADRSRIEMALQAGATSGQSFSKRREKVLVTANTSEDGESHPTVIESARTPAVIPTVALPISDPVSQPDQATRASDINFY